MKRFITSLLAFAFVFSLSAYSFADGETKEYIWSSAKDHFIEVFGNEGYEGYVDEVDATFYIPDSYLPATITKEDVAEGFIGFLVSEDGNSFILFSYRDMDGTSLDSLYSYYVQNGVDAEKVLVNGIPALLQRDTEHNTLLLSYQTQADKLFQLTFSPLSEESKYEYIIASIQPCVEVPATEAVAPVNPVSSLISK